ncbi:hypothetical protein G6514_006698 [Epicoccum nigrum]|nr:hypothetical protein G6514_006698 [Epicoccum nigrum]
MAMHMAAAHAKWGPYTACTSETAYNAAFDTDLPFFDHIAQDEARMQEFAAYMRHVRSSDGLNLDHLIAGFSWRNLREGGLVVDVGGSTGGTAIALARAFVHLSFTVMDFPANAESGRTMVGESQPPSISSRITFQGHDFYEPQPITGADVYLLRMILHDWPDAEAVKILKNLVVAMDAKSRIIIMDTVLPKPGSVPVSVERIARARDMTMLQAFNSKERDLDDWKELLMATEEGLDLVSVTQPPGSALSVLEIKLRSQQ